MPDATSMLPTENRSLAAHAYRPAVRLAVAMLALPILLTVTWFSWATVARHQLERVIAEIRARGEPTEMGEFPNAALDDADNAAVAWQATDAVSATSMCPANFAVYYVYPQYPPAWWTAARASETANAAAFARAKSAATLTRARWLSGQTAITSNPLSAVPCNFVREFSSVLCDSALLAHFGDHDDGRCLERLNDVLSLSDAVDQQPSMMTQLVAIGARARAATHLRSVANQLDVGRPGDGRRAQVKSLIARLLQDPPADARVRAVIAERVLQIQAIRQLHDAYPVLAPMVDLSAARMLRRSADHVRATRATDAASAAAIYATDLAPLPNYSQGASTPGSAPLRISRLFDREMEMVTAGYTALDWLPQAECRVTAVALAVRIYRVDHAGRWPADLAALVPEDLPAVPTDPLPGGAPAIGFVIRRHGRPDFGDRPMLFVGDHDIDRFTAPVPDEPAIEAGKRGQTFWFDLNPWLTPAPQQQGSSTTSAPGMMPGNQFGPGGM